MSFLDPIHRYVMIGKAVVILLLVGLVTYQSSQIHKWHVQSDHCASARALDRAAYVKAQADAKALNDAQVARVKAEQERITGNAEKSYEDDLARLRADLAKRLSARTPAAPGAPGKPDASDLPNAAPAPDDPSKVQISTDLYVHGAELELQLESLQRWVAEQLKIDPNER